jgi:hypothetical protein
MNRSLLPWLALSLCLGLSACDAFGQATWANLNSSGTLVYKSDDLGNHLFDYSYAGYEGGGVLLPIVPTRRAISAVNGDNTTNVQTAINAVEAMPANINGIRGAVVLRAGTYLIDGALTINTSGVVLRGSGDTMSGTVLEFSGAAPETAITLSGSGGASQQSPTSTITDTYVPLGATSFHVSSTSGLSVGTNIIVSRAWTSSWIRAMSQTAYWEASGHQNNAERTITAINGNQVTVNIGIPQPIEQKWVTGQVYPYTDTGRIQKAAIENLYILSDLSAANFSNEAINMNNCKNCWVKNCAFDGWATGVNIDGGGKWNTIQDCSFLNGVNVGSARPPAFQIDGGQMNLFQRLNCISGFEHALQTADESTGPNVYLNCICTGSDFDDGPHRYWSTSVLYDSDTGDYDNHHIEIISGGDNGWGAGFTVFWNCSAGSYSVGEPTCDHTYNWIIGGTGTVGSADGQNGIYDHTGMIVAPQSLYLEQLKERLGETAVHNIGY